MKAQLVEIDLGGRYCLEYDGPIAESQIARIKAAWKHFLENQDDLLVVTQGARLVKIEDVETAGKGEDVRQPTES